VVSRFTSHPRSIPAIHLYAALLWLIIICLDAGSTCSSFKTVWDFWVSVLWLNMCRSSFSKMMYLVILKHLFPRVTKSTSPQPLQRRLGGLQNYISKRNTIYELQKCERTSKSSNFLFFQSFIRVFSLVLL